MQHQQRYLPKPGFRMADCDDYMKNCDVLRISDHSRRNSFRQSLLSRENQKKVLQDLQSALREQDIFSDEDSDHFSIVQDNDGCSVVSELTMLDFGGSLRQNRTLLISPKQSKSNTNPQRHPTEKRPTQNSQNIFDNNHNNKTKLNAETYNGIPLSCFEDGDTDSHESDLSSITHSMIDPLQSNLRWRSCNERLQASMSAIQTEEAGASKDCTRSKSQGQNDYDTSPSMPSRRRLKLFRNHSDGRAPRTRHEKEKVEEEQKKRMKKKKKKSEKCSKKKSKMGEKSPGKTKKTKALAVKPEAAPEDQVPKTSAEIPPVDVPSPESSPEASVNRKLLRRHTWTGPLKETSTNAQSPPEQSSSQSYLTARSLPKRSSSKSYLRTTCKKEAALKGKRRSLISDKLSSILEDHEDGEDILAYLKDEP